MMNRITFASMLCILSCFLGSASCGEQGTGKPAKRPCEGVMCTMLFAAVTVQVQDATGQAVRLDSTQTRNTAGMVIHRGTLNASGIYTVVDDSYQKTLALRTETFTFAGYKGGLKVVEGNFPVSADCCHVSRAGGPDILTLK